MTVSGELCCVVVALPFSASLEGLFMLSVILKTIRAFHPYLHVICNYGGGANFANFWNGLKEPMWTKPAPRKGSKYVFLLFQCSLKPYTVRRGRISIFF